MYTAFRNLPKEKNELIGTVALVYNWEKKLIGYLILMNSRNGFIEFLLVSPKHQGKGYGKKNFEIFYKKVERIK